MKKSTLALSIAAAIGSLGLAGAANAAMSVNPGGIGHQLVFPYFSAQGDNATLLTITNTDTVNGKLVKVRFRGAANSDDLFDFQVLMSPGDVWTAAVSKDATTGLAKLATTDKSCTLPQSVNGTFNTNRLDPSATDAAKTNGTREGYVEVITMGDIDKDFYSKMNATAQATSLYKTVKHVAGVAPCAIAVLQEKLGERGGAKTADTTTELTAPTGGLTGDWIILNQANTAAWSGSATALVATEPTQVVFWPQKDGAVSSSTAPADIAADLLAATADPLLTSGVVTAQNFDLPDMSTVYTTGPANTAALHAESVTEALAVTSVTNQYVTSDDIAAVTDLLFSQPTRRYHVAVNYTAIKDDPATGAVESAWAPLSKTGKDALPVYRNTTSTAVNGLEADSPFYNTTNMAFPAGSRTLCLKSINTPSKDALFDREETTPATSSTGFVISPRPSTTTATVFVCGEAAVMSINNGGSDTDSALSASVARNDVTFTAGFENGWLTFNTAGTGNASGLPILGASFLRFSNGAVNYGTSYGHKVTRPAL